MIIKKLLNNAHEYLTKKFGGYEKEKVDSLESIINETNNIPLKIVYYYYLYFPFLEKMKIQVNEENLHKFDLYIYKNFLYYVECEFESEDEVRLLIMDAYDAERRKFERLKNKFSGDKQEKNNRVRISESVRIEVWRRDQGKCAQCGSRENLEYDHIVPVSKGGSNTARNVELLCEKCNRSKSDNIQ